MIIPRARHVGKRHFENTMKQLDLESCSLNHASHDDVMHLEEANYQTLPQLQKCRWRLLGFMNFFYK